MAIGRRARGRRRGCGGWGPGRGRRRRAAGLAARPLAEARCWARWAAGEELERMAWLEERARPPRRGPGRRCGYAGARALPRCPCRASGLWRPPKGHDLERILALLEAAAGRAAGAEREER